MLRQGPERRHDRAAGSLRRPERETSTQPVLARSRERQKPAAAVAAVRRMVALLICASTAVLSTSAQAQSPPRPPVRSAPSPTEAPQPVLPSRAATLPTSPADAAGACLAKLRANNVEAEAVAAPPRPLADCGVAAPVRLTSLRLSGSATLDLPGRPILDCEFALTFADFVRNMLAPLGQAALGAPVAALDTGPGYECRGRDQVVGAKTSAHGKGIAIDVVAILFADRRRVAIGGPANPREASFVQTMRRAACGWFTTVLGPGSDAAHADHLHFDVLRHGASDDYRICE